MNFLALTPLQAALLALFTAGIIVAFYFLKLRHRRVVVSSSLLWSRVLDEVETRSLWEKLRRLISLLLAVTIGLLIAMAIARPDVPWLTGGADRIIIILDTAPTMLATMQDGQTRWQHAVEMAVSLMDAGGATTEFRLVDTSGRVDTSFTRDRDEARETLARMTPAPADSFRLPILTPAADTRTYFISDGVSGIVPPSQVTSLSVFETVNNIGVTAFEVRSMPAAPLAYEAYLEVYNYGRERIPAIITLSGTGQQRISRNIALNAGERFESTFDLSEFDGGGVRVTVRADRDGFALDDTAYAYIPINKKARTLLVTPGNNFLATVLRLDPLVELTVTSPADFQEDADYDVYVFDRFAPREAPTRPALIFGTPTAPWLKASTGTVNEPSFKTWVDEHPLMQYVSVFDVSIDRASQIDATDLTVVAASDNTPLIITSDRTSDRPKMIMLTFDLDSSDFAHHAGFPIFIQNALGWLSRERLALRRAPGVVEVPFSNAQIRTLEGREVPARVHMDRTVFETTEPGLYLASEGDNRQYIAVNLTDRRYSDVNGSVWAETPVARATPRMFPRELWFYMLGFAIILMAAEWFTYHRRITL